MYEIVRLVCIYSSRVCTYPARYFVHTPGNARKSHYLETGRQMPARALHIVSGVRNNELSPCHIFKEDLTTPFICSGFTPRFSWQVQRS